MEVRGFLPARRPGLLPVPEPISMRLTWGDVGRFVLAFLALTGAFATLGTAVTKWTALTDLDERISESLAANRTPTMDDLTVFGSLLAETWVKIALTAVVVIVCYLLWKRFFEVAFVALSLILEAWVFIVVTWIVERPRPDVVRLDDSPVDSSFPSGHTAAATVYLAIAIVIAWHTRRRWVRALAVVVVALVTFAVAYSRMYRGMHFLTDVIAGVLLGLVTVAVTYWLVVHIARRNFPELDEDADRRLRERAHV